MIANNELEERAGRRISGWLRGCAAPETLPRQARAGLAVMLCMAWAAPLYGASPPLTEDTGTQGQGNFQLEVNYDAVRDREAGVLTKGGKLWPIIPLKTRSDCGRLLGRRKQA